MSTTSDSSAVPKSKVAQYVIGALQASPLSQKDIAEQMKFGKPHILTMIKKGETRMPLYRIPEFARVVECSASTLMRLALEEYHPHEAKAMLAILRSDGVSENEMDLLSSVRHASGGQDPQFADKDLKRISKIVGSLGGD